MTALHEQVTLRISWSFYKNSERAIVSKIMRQHQRCQQFLDKREIDGPWSHPGGRANSGPPRKFWLSGSVSCRIRISRDRRSPEVGGGVEAVVVVRRNPSTFVFNNEPFARWTFWLLWRRGAEDRRWLQPLCKVWGKGSVKSKKNFSYRTLLYGD